MYKMLLTLNEKVFTKPKRFSSKTLNIHSIVKKYLGSWRKTKGSVSALLPTRCYQYMNTSQFMYVTRPMSLVVTFAVVQYIQKDSR